jgi:AcrR family transcriptional regulator
MPRRPDAKKKVILRQAEELFARFGLHGVSIRDIAQAANCLPALVLYHFKSKERLYESVFESRTESLHAVRERLLDSLLEGPDRPRVRDVLRVLAGPWLALRNVPGGVSYARLVAREVGDPSEAERGIIKKILDPTARRTLKALVRAVPELTPSEVHWVYHYFVAALLVMMANTGRIQRLSGANCKLGDANVDEIVEFFGAALESKAGARGSKRAMRSGVPAPRESEGGLGRRPSAARVEAAKAARRA